MSAPPGFELLEPLGEGAMGAVYRARELATNREVALKFLVGTSERQLKRFQREGQTLAALDHPGILRVFSQGEDHGRAYLALELVEGGRTLGDLFAAAPRPTRVGWVKEAAEAVGHAHRAGVVHRDLKPGNIMVNPLGQVKVCDFGLARMVDVETLTRSGTLLGTPQYMSPEQISGRGREAGPESDVWALGVLLYEAATGVLPFRGTMVLELFSQIARASPRAPRELDAEISPALEAVIQTALQRDPAARFPDAGAFAEALAAARLGERPQRPARRRRWGLGLAALGLVGAALWLGVADRGAEQLSPASRGPQVRVETLRRLAGQREWPRIAEATAGVTLERTSLEVLVLRGWALRRIQGRTADALELARALHEAHPGDASVKLLLSACLAEGDEQGVVLCEEACASKPTAYGLVLLAWSMLERDGARAAELLGRSLELEPTLEQRAAALRMQGIVARKLGRHELAVERLRMAARYYDSEVAFQLGLALTDLGRYEEARVEARKLLALDPRDSGALILLGTVCQKSGDRRGAIEAFGQGLDHYPEAWSYNFYLGEALVAAEEGDMEPEAWRTRHERAVKLLERALTLDPPADMVESIRSRLKTARSFARLSQYGDGAQGAGER